MNGNRARTPWVSKHLATLLPSVLAIALGLTATPATVLAQVPEIVKAGSVASSAGNGARSLSALVKAIPNAGSLSGADLLTAIRGQVDWTNPAIRDLVTEARHGNIAADALAAQYPELVPLVDYLAEMPQSMVPIYQYASAIDANASSRLCATATLPQVENIGETLSKAVNASPMSPLLANHPANHLGLSVEVLRANGYVVPEPELLQRGGSKLAQALGSTKGTPAEIFAAMSGNEVWADPVVQATVKAALQFEFPVSELASIDGRLPGLLEHMQLNATGADLPFNRASLSTLPRKEALGSTPLEAFSPDVRAQILEEANGADPSTITTADQSEAVAQRVHRGFDAGPGLNGDQVTGTWTASSYLNYGHEISLPWFVDEADPLKLIRYAPKRFPEVVGMEANKMTPDEFFAYLESKTDPTVLEHIKWQAAQALEHAPPEMAAVLPEGYTVKDVERQFLLAWHHAQDIRTGLAAMGTPQGLHSAHDVFEPELVRSMRDKATSETNRAVVDYIASLDPDAVINVGVISPEMGAQMGFWSMVTGQRGGAHLGDMPDELGMNMHRASAHHTGLPDHPADFYDRFLNQPLHHIVGFQGPWGVRGEGPGIAFEDLPEALESAIKNDPAYKSTIIQNASRRLVPLISEAMQEGYFTPVHLVDWPKPAWSYDIPEITHRSTRLPWNTGLQQELLTKVRASMWDIPNEPALGEGNEHKLRSAIVYLAQSELPRVNEFGIGQPVVMYRYPDDPVKTFTEAVAPLKTDARNWPEGVEAAGQAIYFQLAELALTDTANAQKYIDGMGQIAKSFGSSPEQMAANMEKFAQTRNLKQLATFLGELK